jgi:hypothetical protein
MAVALVLRWEGVTPEQYDALLEKVDWEGRPARDGVFHVVWFDATGMGIVDVWESEQAWSDFMAERLGPAIAELGGVGGEPDVAFHDVHRYFNTEAAAGVA